MLLLDSTVWLVLIVNVFGCWFDDLVYALIECCLVCCLLIGVAVCSDYGHALLLWW